ncbi:unnamed protein product [Adineta steineri]|uniref:NHL repeat containing protein n=1 Tax=Adineta steineri TaxID=433720 RepID=A0A818LIW5_9BILA|nr:unnamed protein product [Adineta steineri]CAF3576631.1 unnamed protein product [Adineta steineri]
MVRSVFMLFVVAVNFVTIDCTTRIGYIYNATYVSNDTVTVITYRNTCSECICYAFFSNVSSSYVGLNCYKSNKTCVLFANYSTPSTMNTNLNSTFIFIKKPPTQNTTAVPSGPVGVTVAGYDNGMNGNNATGLFSPMAISVMANGELYVLERNGNRVQHFFPGSLIGYTVAGDGTSGTGPTQFDQALDIYVDPLSRSVYVADFINNRIQLWMANSTEGKTIISDPTFWFPYYVSGVQLDAQGQIYVSDFYNSQVTRWSRNGTYEIVVAGTGTYGSDNQSLSYPMQTDLDANGTYIYIADWYNHRIQKWKLPKNGSAPATAGITVAGGNGAGSAANQLDSPYGVYVSKKTGTIYVADTNNHRIQRWLVGANEGNTIVGISGSAGAGLNQLNQPAGVALDPNETYIYVADQANHRIQRFIL